MITTIINSLICVLLLRWIIFGTTKLFAQEKEELYRMCRDGLQENQNDAALLSCLLHNGLSE